MTAETKSEATKTETRETPSPSVSSTDVQEVEETATPSTDEEHVEDYNDNDGWEEDNDWGDMEVIYSCT